MAILIENQDNLFSVKGEINKSNAVILKGYIEAQFNRYSEVTVDINNVHRIDKKGIDALTALYQSSLQRGINFRIVGDGCKDIYDDFLLSA